MGSSGVCASGAPPWDRQVNAPPGESVTSTSVRMEVVMRPYLLLAAGALAACGPQMNYPVRDARAFTLSRRCSQGPHDIHVRAIGARWGEEIEVYACSPRDIQGRWDVSVGGESYRDGEYGDQCESIEMEQIFDRTEERRGYYSVDGPDNERCI